MKVLIQRVQSAQVTVDGQTIGQIRTGVLAYIGIGRDDDVQRVSRLIDKILTYRMFEDENGKMGKSVSDVGGGLLLVPQFTLMAKTTQGRRPDFAPAMPSNDARIFFEKLVEYASSVYPSVATGKFGADMAVSSTNDGPINFIMEI